MSWITGVGLLPFGRHDGKGTLDLMSEAATLALADAGVDARRHRRCVDRLCDDDAAHHAGDGVL